jgi:hypothetical protein
MAVYLMNIYGDKKTAAWFEKEIAAWKKKTGKKLDKGKSCIRFKKAEDIPVEIIGRAIRQTSVEDYIRIYEDSRKK